MLLKKVNIMTNKNIETGQISKPRFEFRSFGKTFKETARLLKQLSAPVPPEYRKRTSSEIYIISQAPIINNVKIRDAKLDIKTLVCEFDGLEQWDPVLKVEFPLKADIIRTRIFPALQAEIPEIESEEYTLEEFLKLIDKHPDVQAVTLDKIRYGHKVNNTICEFAKVWINGHLIESISSESTEPEDIKKTIRDLHLKGIENINYPKAIRRMTGIADKNTN
jgi:hypothetical protein